MDQSTIDRTHAELDGLQRRLDAIRTTVRDQLTADRRAEVPRPPAIMQATDDLVRRIDRMRDAEHRRQQETKATARQQPAGMSGRNQVFAMQGQLGMSRDTLERISVEVAGTTLDDLTIDGCYALRRELAKRLSAGMAVAS